MSGGDENPFRSPQGRGARKPIPWRILRITGIVLLGGSFALAFYNFSTFYANDQPPTGFHVIRILLTGLATWAGIALLAIGIVGGLVSWLWGLWRKRPTESDDL